MRIPRLTRIPAATLRGLRRRIDGWVLARVRRERGVIAIGRRRVYIVPTRFGYGFGVITLAMLLAAINYSNSMAFALTFLLAGLGLVCMHHTHANLLNLRVRAGRVRPVFAGETLHFELVVENPADSARFAIAIGWARQAPRHSVDVPAHGRAGLLLAAPARGRGVVHAGVFSVSTDFPLGLFHAWTWAELDMSGIVYPRPAPPGLQPPSAGGGGPTAGGRSGQEEFAGLREYRPGDSLRSIHWKSLPKLRWPMVKQFTEAVDQELWLDWASVPLRDTEARLSQLARWVLDADAQGLRYGLRLPSRQLRPAAGEAHRHECLAALALFGPQTPQQAAA